MTIFTPTSALDPSIQRAIIDAEFARIWAAIGAGAPGAPNAPNAIEFLVQRGVGAATTFQIPAGRIIGVYTCYVPHTEKGGGALTLNWGLTPGGSEVATISVAQGAPTLPILVTPLRSLAPDGLGNPFTLYIDGTWSNDTIDFFIQTIPFSF